MSISNRTLLLLVLAAHGTIQKSSPESSSYRAAVVEMESVYYINDPHKTLNGNAEKAVKFIELAARKNTDILVFPELSLTSLNLGERSELLSRSTIVPDPSQNYAPCTNFSISVVEGLRKVACAADRNDIYVTINLFENELCSPSEKDCPSDGVFLYISTVVFDRDGKIIARYRKSHLFDEETGLINHKKLPEISTFNTDFGVTFGNIICFDIMYEEPWLTLTRKLNITDIIYTAGWYSEMPFLNAIQVETGWSYVEDVNFLAAGQNVMKWGNSGSGIYAGRQGVITSALLLDSQEVVLIADVPKKFKNTAATLTLQHDKKHHLILRDQHVERYLIDKPHQEGESESFNWIYDKLDTLESKVIDKNGYTVQKLKQLGIECEFQLNVTNLSPPVTYRLLAFDGTRVFGSSTPLGVKVCAIVHCSNDTIDSCGRVQNSSAVFNHIVVNASYIDNQRIQLIPSTLGSDMLALKDWTFDEHKEREHVLNSISLTAPTQNLITFGLWGRDFEKDKLSINSACRISSPFLCFLLLFVFFDNV